MTFDISSSSVIRTSRVNPAQIIVIACCEDHIKGHSITVIGVLGPSHTVKACSVAKSIVQPFAFSKYGPSVYIIHNPVQQLKPLILLGFLNVNTQAWPLVVVAVEA